MSKTLWKLFLEADYECAGAPPFYIITNGAEPSEFEGNPIRKSEIPEVPFTGYTGGDELIKVAEITDEEFEILKRLVSDSLEIQNV